MLCEYKQTQTVLLLHYNYDLVHEDGGCGFLRFVPPCSRLLPLQRRFLSVGTIIPTKALKLSGGVNCAYGLSFQNNKDGVNTITVYAYTKGPDTTSIPNPTIFPPGTGGNKTRFIA